MSNKVDWKTEYIFLHTCTENITDSWCSWANRKSWQTLFNFCGSWWWQRWGINRGQLDLPEKKRKSRKKKKITHMYLQENINIDSHRSYRFFDHILSNMLTQHFCLLGLLPNIGICQGPCTVATFPSCHFQSLDTWQLPCYTHCSSYFHTRRRFYPPPSWPYKNHFTQSLDHHCFLLLWVLSQYLF